MSLQPHEYPRRILLAVAGLNPQVVTETLYAMAVRKVPSFVPTEIHLLTTAEGRQRAELALISDEPGWFHRLREDYGLPPIAFDAEHIHVISAPDGQMLEDIRSPADNECLADQITERVRKLTADDDCAVHVSIAGGRKTMGFYLGYALSLFGRPWDSLSHVLVSQPFESSWDFFYPTPYSRVITTREDRLADTRDAKVDLADIPFVRLRSSIPEPLRQGRESFSGVVAAAQHFLEPELIIDRQAQRIRAAWKEIQLPHKQLALLSLFAQRVKDGEERLPAPTRTCPIQHGRAVFSNSTASQVRGGELDDLERTEQAPRYGMDGDYFSSTKSKLHRALKTHLDDAAGLYYIDDGGSRPRRYALRLPRSAVRFGRLDDREGGNESNVDQGESWFHSNGVSAR